MWRILQVDLGFRVEQVLKAEYQLPASRYPEDRAVWPNWPAHLRFTREVLHRAAALPGAQGVALAGAHGLPMENSTIRRGMDQMNRNTSHRIKKVPTPFVATIRGNRQMLPVPTAMLSIASNIAPRELKRA